MHPAFASQAEHLAQLHRHHFEVQFRLTRTAVALHLAVNTVERAELVRVEIDPDGQTARALRDDRVDEMIVEEPARCSQSVSGWPLRGTGRLARIGCHGASVSLMPLDR